MPAFANDSGAPSAGDLLAAGQSPGQSGSPDTDPSAQLTALIGKIRQLDQAAQGIFAEAPMLAAEGQQFRQLLKRMIVKVGQGAGTSTPSADQLPTG